MAIHTMHYNFVRIHQTLRCTPAMAAGVTPKIWELADLVNVTGGPGGAAGLICGLQFAPLNPRGFPSLRCGGNIMGNCSIPASEHRHNPEPVIG